jgi:ribosomal protein S14
LFEKLLGDGSRLGCKLSYKVQEVPNGLAHAFVLGEEFIGNDEVCLILGDNIFQMKIKLLSDISNIDGGVVFGYHVTDPERYGVVEFNENNKAISLEERFQAQLSLGKLPRNSSKNRIRNRCLLSGRGRGVLRKFCLSRIWFRKLALECKLPGVIKASW